MILYDESLKSIGSLHLNGDFACGMSEDGDISVTTGFQPKVIIILASAGSNSHNYIYVEDEGYSCYVQSSARAESWTPTINSTGFTATLNKGGPCIWLAIG